MARKHFTALGEQIDMGALVARHSNTVAIGNARMNARGDRLGENGTVLKTQEQIEAEWNRVREAREASTGHLPITPDIKAPLPDSPPGKQLADDQEFDPDEAATGIIKPPSGQATTSQQGRRRRMVDSDQ